MIERAETIHFGTCACGAGGVQLFRTGKCAHCYIAELEASGARPEETSPSELFKDANFGAQLNEDGSVTPARPVHADKESACQCVGCSAVRIALARLEAAERSNDPGMDIRDAIFHLHESLKAKPVALSAGEGQLTFDAFRHANVTRCLKWHPAGIESWSPSDWLTAVTGELGELASLLKMRNRERDGLPGNKFSPTDKQIADELADVLTYLDLLAAALGVDLGAATVQKFNEVSERVGFPDRIELAKGPADG